MKNEIVLSEEVENKLAEAVELWADGNLAGKPALLATGMYYGLRAAMIKQIEKINETFT